MEVMKGENLLIAQTHIWNQMSNFINSMSLKCAIELGIPDTIHSHGKPMTLSQLTSKLLINQSKSNCIYRLMRILVHSGFFCQEKLSELNQEQGYVMTDASRLLLKNNPMSVSPFVLAALNPVSQNSSHYLGTWFQNEDSSPFVTANGMSFWDYCAQEPKFNNLFNDAMENDTRFVTKVLMERCQEVFIDLGSLVDVGGGTGTMAKGIAKAFPNIVCTVFDLPHVVDGLQDSENVKYVGGDMFQSIPPADAILLKWILHNWNDEECVKILRKCKESIIAKAKGNNNHEGQVSMSKVILIEMVLNKDDKGSNDESIKTQLFLDMAMMLLYTGKERNEKEWAELIFSAGFKDYKITPILGSRSLIEAFP